MNTYFAVSLDLYNKKEYIIYSIGGKEITKVRELGELLFDFADQTDKSERYNAAAEYLACFSEKKITPLLTDDFFEAQRHLHLNGEHRYSSCDVIDCYSDKHNKPGKLAAFYVDDKLYMAVKDNFELLLRYYLDVIYSIRLFPRKCKGCNNIFLARTHLFDVLCSDNCKMQRNSEKLSRYKEKHNDEYEAQYMKVYQRWYTRIRRAKEKGRLPEDKLQYCNDLFADFTAKSRQKRNDVHNQNITSEEYERWLIDFDEQMNQIYL